MSLTKLDDVVKLSSNVVRILGQNPGPYTLQGTNCYILHGRVLIDTAEGGEEFIKLLREAIESNGSEPITDIILSHHHLDHINGLPEVLRALEQSSPPRVHKWGSEEHDAEVLAKLQSVYPDAQLYTLSDGQSFTLDDAGATATVLHAPGHTSDSIALRLSTGELLTADTVLGEGTAVFEDLGVYLATLQRLLDALGSSPDEVVLFPGHGPVIAEGKDRLRTYIKHRLERENQVVQALRQGPATIGELVDRVYGDTLVEQLKGAAARGLMLHLGKLQDERRTEEADGQYRIVASAKM